MQVLLDSSEEQRYKPIFVASKFRPKETILQIIEQVVLHRKKSS